MKPRHVILATGGVLLVILTLILVAKRILTSALPAEEETQTESRQARVTVEPGFFPSRGAPLQPLETPASTELDHSASTQAAQVIEPNLAPVSATPRTRTVNAKEPLEDPIARIALAFVGADPEAEEYWFYAINDPNLPPGERRDLIEDLNEDGLTDPKQPNSDDVPLILNRLWIIERLAPYAMDEVNANAFAEAYKDLLNLLAVAMGAGQSVN
jgi:hypothetical protein